MPIVKFPKLFVISIGIVWIVAGSVSGQCPSITVVGPEGLTRIGGTMTFRVEPRRSDLKYSWTVSEGTIAKGQGTPVIDVVTDETMAGRSLTATVNIAGLRPDCPASASEAAPVDPGIGCGLVMDEWEGLKPNDERGRLDAFFAELANNPTNTGVVFLNVTEKERFDSANKRLKLIVNHAKFREFDLNRIWIVLDRTGSSRTKIYRVPPGAEMVPCDATCITIKGGDL